MAEKKKKQPLAPWLPGKYGRMTRAQLDAESDQHDLEATGARAKVTPNSRPHPRKVKETSQSKQKTRIPFGGLVVRTKVRLHISANNLDPDQITEWLGRNPTKSWREGDVRIGKSTGKQWIHKHGAWILEVPLPHKASAEDQLNWLLKALPSNLDVWRQLTDRFFTVIVCGLFLDRLNREFNLSSKIMKQLAERNLPITFDIYAP